MLIMKEEREAIVLENKGQKIFGILHLPHQEYNGPVVLVLHGFASSKMGTHRSWVKLATSLVKEGLGCFRFDFRGAGDSEGASEDMTIEDFISDAQVAILYLKKRGFENIGIFGSSFGGSIAIIAASRLPVEALALWAPVASGLLWFQDWISRQEGSIQPLVTYQGVEISETFKREFSKFHPDHILAELNHIPLLHMQCEEDHIVTTKHADSFQKARKGSLADTHFIKYQDGEHQLGKSSLFPQACHEICQWFKSHLGQHGRNL